VDVDRKATMTICKFGKFSPNQAAMTHAKMGFKFTASEIKVTE